MPFKKVYWPSFADSVPKSALKANKNSKLTFDLVLFNPDLQVGEADPGLPDVKPCPLMDLNELMHKARRTVPSLYFCFLPFGCFY